MENLNAEEVKRGLECCTSPDKTADCPIGCPFGDINSCEESLMYHVLALIKSYEEQIFTLENRLKERGHEVVEDAKGYRDPESAVYKVFVLKRKLMLHKYGIKIQEV